MTYFTLDMHIPDDVAGNSFADPVAIAFFISTTSSSFPGPRLCGLSGVDDIGKGMSDTSFGLLGKFDVLCNR